MQKRCIGLGQAPEQHPESRGRGLQIAELRLPPAFRALQPGAQDDCLRAGDDPARLPTGGFPRLR